MSALDETIVQEIDVDQYRDLFGFRFAVRAEQKGNIVIILSRLPDLVKRCDGRKTCWRIELRYLSDAEDLTSVTGNEFQYFLPKKELNIDIQHPELCRLIDYRISIV